MVEMKSLITREKRTTVPYTYQEDKKILTARQEGRTVDDIINMLDHNRTRSAIKHRFDLYDQLDKAGLTLEIYYGESDETSEDQVNQPGGSGV